MASGDGERVVRVFISSTFRDMVEDRNELMARTWPALRRLCRSRSVEFVDIDLRWGITEEQAQRQETIRHCLQEINRCRPYFIGLIGERYGWVPGAEAYSSHLLREEKWLEKEIAKKSVTELEIIHGVLNNPEMAGRAFFYFRDPGYAASRGADFESSNPESKELQDSLKRRIRLLCQERHIPLAEGDSYRNPQLLASLVLGDLTIAINEEFPSGSVPDAETQETRLQEAYARSKRTSYYIGRPSYFEQLDRYGFQGLDDKGLLIVGNSGGGKSTLLANWLSRWRSSHPDDFVFQHYIGSSPASASHFGIMRRLMTAIDCRCRDDATLGESVSEDESIPHQPDEILRLFPHYLDQLSSSMSHSGRNAILVIDALSQLEDQDNGRFLGWLPFRLPRGLRLIVSTLPGDTLEALQPRNWPTLTVEPLNVPERTELITRYLSFFSQSLSPDRAARISAAPASSNPLFLKCLLEDLRITGAHETLDRHISQYLEAPDLPALLSRILERYEREYDRDWPGLVKATLSLLWAARRGLTEPELFDVLSQGKSDRLPNAIWTPLRLALEDSLVDRDGVLSFAHDHLRQAVERRYVPDAATARNLRLQLAYAFDERTLDARQSDELPWLLYTADERDRLRECILNIDRFRFLKASNQDELRRYWIWLKEERAMGELYQERFEDWRQNPNLSLVNVAFVADELARYLFNSSLYVPAEALYHFALSGLEQELGSSHLLAVRCLKGLAVLFQQTNRSDEAKSIFRRVLNITEETMGYAHPLVGSCLRSLAAACVESKNRDGRIEGESLLLRAISIFRQSYGDYHLPIARCLTTLGQLLKDQSRFKDAEASLRRAIDIIERNCGSASTELIPVLNCLADLLFELNRFPESREISQRALNLAETNYGPESAQVAGSLTDMAFLLRASRRFGEAEALIRRALAINEKNFGPEHYAVAVSLTSLSSLLQETYRLEEAETLARRALSINERVYGKDHPSIAIRLCALALILRSTGRLDEAEALARHALAIDEKSYGLVHGKVAATLGDLFSILYEKREFTKAESIAKRQLAIDESLHAPDQLAVVMPLLNLSTALIANEKFEDAETLLRRAISIARRYGGDSDSKVASCQLRLGEALRHLRQLDEAEASLNRALAIFEASEGDHSLLMVSVLVELAEVAISRGQVASLEAARSYLQRALSTAEAALGYVHPGVADLLTKLGGILIKEDETDKAMLLIKRAQRIYESTYGKAHQRVSDCLAMRGNALLDKNRLSEAEPLLHEFVQIQKQLHGSQNEAVANCLLVLGKITTSLNRSREAETYLTESVDVFLAIAEQRGEVRPNFEEAIQSLGSVLEKEGRLEELRRPMVRLLVTLVAWSRKHKATHPGIPRAVDAYGELMGMLGYRYEMIASELRGMGLGSGRQ